MIETNTTANILDSDEVKDIQYFPLEGIPGEDSVDEPITVESDFPVHVFPEPFKRYIDETRRTLNYPVDYTGTALIAAVSVAIGNTAHIKLKEGYITSPILYAALVGPSGVSKTHPLKGVLEVFKESDRQEYKRYGDEMKQYKIDLAKFNKRGKKSDSDSEPPQEPRSLQSTVFTQTTPEAAIKFLQGNKRGCVVHSDELVTFLKTLTAYQKSDDLSFLLSNWDGTSITQHRVDEVRHVDDPFMSLIGGIQPRLIPTVFTPHNVDNGLLQRFLWAYPDDFTCPPITLEGIDKEVTYQLHDWFKNYRTQHPLTIHPTTYGPLPEHYTLTQDALELCISIHNQYKERMNTYPDGLEREVLSKLDNHHLRLTLILHVMNQPHTSIVNKQAVQAAAELVEYYEFGANKVVNLLKGRGPVLDQRKDKFYQALPPNFTTAEAVKIGAGQSISESTVKYYLNHSNSFTSLLTKLDTGKFKKNNP